MITLAVHECPQCGASASALEKNCAYCKAVFFVTSPSYLGGLEPAAVRKYAQHYQKLAASNPDSFETLVGLGLTQMHLGMHAQAIPLFEKATSLSPEAAAPYYFCCLAKIGGRRVMALNLTAINELEGLATAALRLEPENSLFALLLAMIRKDYYVLNRMKAPYPSHLDLLDDLAGKTVTSTDLLYLKKFVAVAGFDGYTANLTITN